LIIIWWKYGLYDVKEEAAVEGDMAEYANSMKKCQTYLKSTKTVGEGRVRGSIREKKT
jgi:hypothetical protein